MFRPEQKQFNNNLLLVLTKELIKHSGEGDIIELNKLIEKEERKEKREEQKLIHPPKEDKAFTKIKNRLNPRIIQRQQIPLKPQEPSKPLNPKKQRVPLKPSEQKVPLMPSEPKMPQIKPITRVLRVPKQKLPQYLKHLRPSPTNTQLDLGKIENLVRDPKVQAIDCEGADKNIIVRGTMGTKKTNIILNKEEIEGILKKF